MLLQLAGLRCLTGLTQLQLRGHSRKLTAAGLQQLTSFRRLHSLGLVPAGRRLTEEVLQQLLGLPQLQLLRLGMQHSRQVGGLLARLAVVCHRYACTLHLCHMVASACQKVYPLGVVSCRRCRVLCLLCVAVCWSDAHSRHCTNRSLLHVDNRTVSARLRQLSCIFAPAHTRQCVPATTTHIAAHCSSSSSSSIAIHFAAQPPRACRYDMLLLQLPCHPADGAAAVVVCCCVACVGKANQDPV
jgi:hypothetical protein